MDDSEKLKIVRYGLEKMHAMTGLTGADDIKLRAVAIASESNSDVGRMAALTLLIRETLRSIQDSSKGDKECSSGGYSSPQSSSGTPTTSSDQSGERASKDSCPRCSSKPDEQHSGLCIAERTQTVEYARRVFDGWMKKRYIQSATSAWEIWSASWYEGSKAPADCAACGYPNADPERYDSPIMVRALKAEARIKELEAKVRLEIGRRTLAETTRPGDSKDG